MAFCIVLAGCGEADPATGSGPSQTTAPVALLDLYEVPVADAPDPADRGAAASRYVECSGGISNGGWSPDFGGPASGASDPAAALEAFLADGLFALPNDGFTLTGQDEGRALFTYTVDGSAKVAVIVALADGEIELHVDQGWVVETFATCDPFEFDPADDDHLPFTVWSDAAGNRVATSTITSSSGPAHCGWEDVMFLSFGDRMYLRDPDAGGLGSVVVSPYNDDSGLPGNATDTGYRNDGQELWLSEDGTVAYVVGSERTEAWPSTVEPVLCA